MVRRVTRGVLAVAGLVGLGVFAVAGPGALAAPAAGGFAAPAPSGPADGAPAATPGKPVCTVADTLKPTRLVELSGLAATANGYWTVNDSTDVDNRARVFLLDKTSCKVAKEVRYSGNGPYDPEDLAVGKDGTVWVADIGDNEKKRPSIGLWKIPPNSTTATLFRLRYPQGKFNAEALLLDANDQPIIVTKDATSSLFTLKEPLVANSTQGVLLQKVGEFKPQRTGTESGLGPLKTQVTGGANSPDRKKVVLRTYSDAYEWDVPDGDVVKAITTGKPRITPLPNEPWGEAITFSPDGATFLTVSETAQLGDPPPPPQILQYTPSTGADVAPAPTGPGGTKRNTLSWYERLSLAEATSLVAAVGVLGVLLVIVGVVGILHARRARPTGRDGPGADAGGDRGATGALATQKLTPNARGGQAYYTGGTGYGAEADGADEHWRRPAPEYGGGQYAGGQYSGGQYGGGQPGYGPGDPHGPAAGYPPPAGR